MIHIVNLNGSTVELKASAKDVIKIEGIKDVYFNGFKIESVSSEESTVFYVTKEGLYSTDGGYINVHLVGQTSEFHDLREVLGLDYNFPDNYVTFKDIPEGGSGGGDFDPTKYYTKDKTYSKVESDAKFELKGSGGSPVDAYTKGETDELLSKKVDKPAVINFEVKFNRPTFVSEDKTPDYPNLATRQGNFISIARTLTLNDSRFNFTNNYADPNSTLFTIPPEHAPTMRRSCNIGAIQFKDGKWEYKNIVGILNPTGDVKVFQNSGLPYFEPNAIIQFTAEYDIFYNDKGNRPPDPVIESIPSLIPEGFVEQVAEDYLEMHEKVDVVYTGMNEAKEGVKYLKDHVYEKEAVDSQVRTLNDTIASLVERINKLEGVGA